jgi:hypothetical protein
MKWLASLLFFGIMLGACKDDDLVSLQGTWEPEPEHESAGPLIFHKNGMVYGHIIFDSVAYRQTEKNIGFFRNEQWRDYSYKVLNQNQIEFYNFITGSVTANVKNVKYTRVK